MPARFQFVRSARGMISTTLLFVFVLNVADVHAQDIEEIEIIAEQTESEVLNDLVSVSALDGEKLADAGIENIEDAAAYVPNLVLAQTETGTNIVIRGIGAGVNQGFDQSVGLFVDGVPLPRSQMARAPFLDLDGLEVLRGPQYVLDGNFSLAGSVHMQTKQTLDEFEAGIDFNYVPSQNDRSMLVTMGIPLIEDVLGLRFAAQRKKSDGYIENVTRNEDGPQEDESLYRFIVGFTPIDSLSFKLKAEVGSFDVRGRQAEIIESQATPDFRKTALFDTQGPQGVQSITRTADPTGSLTKLYADQWLIDADYIYKPNGIPYDAARRTLRTGPSDRLNFTLAQPYFAGSTYLELLANLYTGVGDAATIASTADLSKDTADGAVDGSFQPPAGLRDDKLDFKRGADADEFSFNDSINITLNTNYYLGEHELTLTSSYIDYELEEFIDLDFTAAPLLTTSQDEAYTQAYHRFDYKSPVEGFLQFRAGVSYLNAELTFNGVTDTLTDPSADIGDAAAREQRSIIFDPDYPLASLFGGWSSGAIALAGFENLNIFTRFEQEQEIIAAYLRTKINFTDTVRTTLGLRYTYSEKEAVRDVAILTPSGEPLDPDSPKVGGGTIESDVRQAVARYDLFFGVRPHSDRYGDLISSLAYERVAPALRGVRREEKFLPSLTLEWDALDNLSLFGSVRLANKLGGFDALSNSTPTVVYGRGNTPGTFEFEDEDATTYELGFKWYGGLGQFYATVFFTEFNNLQVSRFDGKAGSNVDNAGAAETRGVEVEGVLQLTDRFGINYSMAWIDFEFTDFDFGSCHLNRRPDFRFVGLDVRAVPALNNAYGGLDVVELVYPDEGGTPRESAGRPPYFLANSPTQNLVERVVKFDNFAALGTPAFCDFSGQTNQYVAEWQGTFSFNYTSEIQGANAVIKSTLDVIYNHGYHTTVTQDPDVEQEQYTLLNGRLALLSGHDTWEVALTGSNLTNEKVVSYAAELPIASRIAGSKSHYGFIRPPRAIGLNVRYKLY